MVSEYVTGCLRFTGPCPFGPFGLHSKFEVLLAKAFILKQKKNKIKCFQLLQKKSNFNFHRKQSMVRVDKRLQWVNKSHLERFRHNQA